MKKIILLAVILFFGEYRACADYDESSNYFNLFTQTLVLNKEYQPFLLTYENGFYDSNTFIKDENVEAWQIYFNNELDYEETSALIKLVDVKHLNNLKNGKITHQLLQNTKSDFYAKYKEGIDYLIEAKYLEPYMRIKFQENPDSFYYRNTDEKDATLLDYSKTIATLTKLYNAAKSREIKLRYGYQLVRFNHYTRNFTAAISAFNKFVEPIKRDTPIYWYALDQKAGAERGLNKMEEANYNFFEVFIHSRNRKESAYTSMTLSNDHNFQSLLKMAKTAEERNMAYFLLAYNEFSNPVPIMEKMLANKAESDILKILTARAINSLERSYLPVYYYCDKDCDTKNQRLPLFNGYVGKDTEDYAAQLKKFIQNARSKSDDDYWKMADAYVQFLNGDHKKSMLLLNQIKSTNSEYIAEIDKLKMLNEIVSQPKITSQFEIVMMQKYQDFFQENISGNMYSERSSTQSFIRDILANRYFLQGEDGKSFLMNNQLSDLQFNPNSKLVKKVDEFYQKKNKNIFEDYIAKNFNNVGNTEAFFNVIYGDFAMRQADFQNAKNFYQKAQNFTGIPRQDYDYSGETYTVSMRKYTENEYDGFRNISGLIFGHNVIESFQSPEEYTMRAENTQAFPFITEEMNKLELANAAMILEKAGKEKSGRGAKANQLLGNLLYNTSKLGYYRETFVMDINNDNGPKFHYNNLNTDFHYYYKNFGWNSTVEPDNFDLAISYYEEALKNSNDREQQARILFQMASAEQGKYYQAPPVSSATISWDDPNYESKTKKIEQKENEFKNKNFRSNFAILKNKYADTKTVKSLRSSCLYFGYYMRK